MQQWRPNLTSPSSTARLPPQLASRQQEPPPGLRLSDRGGPAYLQVSQPLQALLGLRDSSVALGEGAIDTDTEEGGDVRVRRDVAVSPPPLTPQQQEFRTQSFDTLLNRYVDVARADRADAGEESDRLMTSMLDALRTDPSRSGDLALLRNAYFPLKRFFIALRGEVDIAAAEHPSLHAFIRQAAFGRVGYAVGLARKLPPPADPEDTGPSIREEPLWRMRPRADTLIASARERVTAQKLQADVQRARVFLAGEAQNRIVGGAAVPQRTEVYGLVGGDVVIAAPDEAALREVLVHLPMGKLVENPARNFGYFLKAKPPTYHATYPPRGWRQTVHEIHWRPDANQPDKQTLVLVALHGSPPRPSYSLDEGVTWKPTGAPHLPALSEQLANLWSGYLNRRLLQYVRQYHEGNKGIGGR